MGAYRRQGAVGALCVLGMLAAPRVACAQAAVRWNRNDIVYLKDGTPVLLAEAYRGGSAEDPPPTPNIAIRRQFMSRRMASLKMAIQQGEAPAKDFLYLPLRPRLARKATDNTPMFLYASYNKSKRNNDTGVDQVGAILHFNMDYGLTSAQQAELITVAQKKYPGCTVRGAMPVMPDGDLNTLTITSAVLSSEDLTRKVISTGKAPSIEGARIAAAARLTGDGAQIFENTLKLGKGAADLSVTFNLAYYAMVPGIDAKITFDWSKYRNQQESYDSAFKDKLMSIDANGNYGGWFFKAKGKFSANDRRVSKDEAKAFYDFLTEKGVVKFEDNSQIADQTIRAKYLDAFFNMFMETVCKKEPPSDSLTTQPSLSPPNMSGYEGLKKDPAKADEASTGFLGLGGGVSAAGKIDTTQYRVRQYTVNNLSQKQSQVWTIKVSMPVRQTIQITGNIAEYYDQVKDNKACVMRFYLDDPFFAKFDVIAPLNVATPELFTQFANYVTVSCRKKRKDGTDWVDSKTFTRKDAADSMMIANFSYAGGDTNEDSREFEYMAQWGLKNGKVWPEKPTWSRSSLEGIQINPPLVPMEVEAVGDTAGMTEKGVIRAVAQLHYLTLGEERETNVPIAPTQATDGVKKLIFVDREVEAYVYRVVFYTKDGKRFATDWQKGDATGVCNVSAPSDLLENAEFLTRAEKMKPGVLDKVKDLILGAAAEGANP
jgi:hypothetical protein